MKYTNEDTIKKLENYGELNRIQKQLEYELENFIDMVTADDVIESMTFKSGTAERVSGGGTSDRTADISAAYNDRTCLINARAKKDIQMDLERVTREINRLTYYAGLLDAELGEAVKAHFFESLNIPRTAERLGVGSSTVKRRLRQAVTIMTRMFNLIVS